MNPSEELRYAMNLKKDDMESAYLVSEEEKLLKKIRTSSMTSLVEKDLAVDR